jgi:hypothetical protein
MLLPLVLKAAHWMFLMLLLLLLHVDDASGVISEWRRQWDDSFEGGGGGGGSTGKWGKIQYFGRKIMATPSGSFSQEMPLFPPPSSPERCKMTRVLATSHFDRWANATVGILSLNDSQVFFCLFFSFQCPAKKYCSSQTTVETTLKK